MIQQLADKRPATTGGDDDLDHVVCCDEDTALCGRDVSGDPMLDGDWDEDEATVCVVCVDLVFQPSPCCGLVIEP